MAQTYTLDEAAGRLALPTEEFKRRLKDEWKQIRSFRDGPTLRFRAADIDELARVMGEASDPGLQLGPVGAAGPDDSSDDFLLAPDPPAKPAPSAGPKPVPLAPAPSSVKLGRPKPNLKPADDSGVKLDPPAGGRAGDSGLSLPTEEIDLDLSGPGSAIIRPGQSGKLPPLPKPSGMIPKQPAKSAVRPGNSPPSGKIPGPAPSKIAGSDSSSEFELSLDADSDSFELNLTDDKSGEMDLGGVDLGPPGAARGGLSGINLGRPADSGLSLEGGGPKGSGAGQPRSSKLLPKSGPKTTGPHGSTGSSADFELALDSGSSPRGGAGGESDSEFELSLEGGSPGADTGPKTAAGIAGPASGEIFETDFELPSVDDSSELVVEGSGETDSSSDFDLAISDADFESEDESASQVVLVDDEEAAADEVVVEEGDGVALEEDDGHSAAAALAGARPGYDEDDDGPVVRTVAAPPTQWGVLPTVVLLPSLLLVFLGGLMSFELLRGMWGYHQPSKPSSMILRAMADNLGMKVND